MIKFFGKKKEDEEEEKLEQKKPTGKKRGRPKKEEKEKKPWTKKERYVVLIVLLLTAMGSFYFYLKSRSFKLPGVGRISMPNISLSKTIILEKKDDGAGREVVREVEDLTKGLSGVYGFWVYEFDSGKSYGIYENEEFTAASLIKLPYLIALYDAFESGNIDLDEEYILKDEDKLGGAGSLRRAQEGSVITYREMADLMGKQSDNTAFNIVRRKVGNRATYEIMNEIGLNKTDLVENESTPYDMGLLLRELYSGTTLEEKSGNAILDSLTDTDFEEWITEGVPEDVRVSHKFGLEAATVNDAGIVYGEHPYILVVMSKGVLTDEAGEVIPQISKAVYEFIE